MGDITFSNLSYESAGSQKKVIGKMTFSADYATGGDVFNIKKLGLAQLKDIVFEDTQGYAFDFINTNPLSYANIVVRLGAGGGTIGNTSGGTPAGTNSAPALTMNSYTPAGTNANSVCTGQLDLATPVFSGTGYSTVGQVVTTTDNQTMTLNQCAGMWLIGNVATEAPVLIVSNTAVTGAPAVLTVIGTAPVTDAGAYKIVRTVGTASAQTFSGTPATLTGSVAAPVFTGSALAAHTHTSTGGASAEAPAHTNLSTVVVDFTAYGY